MHARNADKARAALARHRRRLSAALALAAGTALPGPVVAAADLSAAPRLVAVADSALRLDGAMLEARCAGFFRAVRHRFRAAGASGAPLAFVEGLPLTLLRRDPGLDWTGIYLESFGDAPPRELARTRLVKSDRSTCLRVLAQRHDAAEPPG